MKNIHLQRRKNLKSLPLKGSQQHNCIAVLPYGGVMTRNMLDMDDDSTFECKFKPTYGVCSDDFCYAFLSRNDNNPRRVN